MTNRNSYAWPTIALGLWLLISQSGQCFYHPEGGVIGRGLAAVSAAHLQADPLRFATKHQKGEVVFYGYRYYNASTGRWLTRDPIGERGGINLLAFTGNDLINMADNLGLKLSKEGGAKAINDGLSSVQAACDKGCGLFHCCSKKKCREEAAKLIQLLADAWTRNYGSGPHNDNPPPPDTSASVGGYLCWDWAAIFQDTASSTKFKCFSFEIGMAVGADTPKGTQVHYYLEVYACKRHSDTYRISVDDGFYDGYP